MTDQLTIPESTLVVETVPDTQIDFLYLSEPDMIRAGVTDMSSCVTTMEEVLVLLREGDYRMAGANSDSHGAMMTFPTESPFPGMPLDGPDRRFMAMPAYLGGSFKTTGVKWYGSNMANREKGLPRSILMFTLSDTVTGAPLAFMSANLLSAYRTGAIPGVGARHLARKDARSVGLLGPGVMAKTSLLAFAAARPGLDTLKVMGRSASSTESFIAWVAATLPQFTTVSTVDSIEDVVRDSDIVTFCTSGAGGDPSLYPTVEHEWVKPGAFLSMPALCDIDERMQGADVRKVVDNLGLYEAWHDELPKPLHESVYIIGAKFMDMVDAGTMTKEEIIDLGGVVAGDVVGRQSDDEIILLSVGGMPIEDVAWGTVVYRRALAEGIGVRLPLWDTPALS